MSELNQIRSPQAIRPLVQERKPLFKKKNKKKKREQSNKENNAGKAKVDEYI